LAASAVSAPHGVPPRDSRAPNITKMEFVGL